MLPCAKVHALKHWALQHGAKRENLVEACIEPAVDSHAGARKCIDAERTAMCRSIQGEEYYQGDVAEGGLVEVVSMNGE